jgi:putative ABC transport system permease protein
MKVPLKYIYRSLFARKLTTFLTILGISLVSFLFCGVLMLADGIAKVLTSTGENDNVMILQKDKFSAEESSLTPEQADRIEELEGFVMDENLGEQLLAPELVVSIQLENKDDDKLKNLTLRGVVEASTYLRRNFRLIDGELYEMGLPTCIVGRIVAEKIKNCRIGDSIKINNDYYYVNGIFETGGTLYDSEIWADIYSLTDSYNRSGVAGSLILARIEKPDEYELFDSIVENIPDLEVSVVRETSFYERQTEFSTRFLKILGFFICIVFALGATIGAMITMYSAVANRINEIATMRALGFHRRSILAAFLLESISIGIIGAIIGIVSASSLQMFEMQMFSTVGFFGEFYLRMTLTMLTVLLTFGFAILMGLLGGVLPSVRASRMKILDAFRAV